MSATQNYLLKQGEGLREEKIIELLEYVEKNSLKNVYNKMM